MKVKNIKKIKIIIIIVLAVLIAIFGFYKLTHNKNLPLVLKSSVKDSVNKFKANTENKYTIYDLTNKNIYYNIDLKKGIINKWNNDKKLYTKNLDYMVNQNIMLALEHIKSSSSTNESEYRIITKDYDNKNFDESTNAYIKSMLKDIDKLNINSNAFKLDKTNEYLMYKAVVCDGCDANSYYEINLNDGTVKETKSEFDPSSDTYTSIITKERVYELKDKKEELTNLINEINALEEDDSLEDDYYYIIESDTSIKNVFNKDIIQRLETLLTDVTSE